MAALKTISSRDNPAVKTLRALAGDARESRRQGRTLIDGPHLLASFRQHGGVPAMLAVNAAALADVEIAALLADLPEVPTMVLSDGLFREISSVVTPTGILAVIAIPEPPSAPVRESCVMLDAVQDAGNVGAILRTAAAAGVRDILLGPGCAGAWTPRVLRAAQGAHFTLRIREQVDLLQAIRAYPGKTLATVARDGGSLYDLHLTDPLAWIFGNEGAGVSPRLTLAARRQVQIPLASEVESLNVAAAAAVCLFETVRQRLAGGPGTR